MNIQLDQQNTCTTHLKDKTCRQKAHNSGANGDKFK